MYYDYPAINSNAPEKHKLKENILPAFEQSKNLFIFPFKGYKLQEQKPFNALLNSVDS